MSVISTTANMSPCLDPSAAIAPTTPRKGKSIWIPQKAGTKTKLEVYEIYEENAIVGNEGGSRKRHREPFSCDADQRGMEGVQSGREEFQPRVPSRISRVTMSCTAAKDQPVE